MNYYCISDLHIGDKSRKDDFMQNEQKLTEFLQSIPDKSLILVGDILELWQCKAENIFKAYKELLSLLLTKTKYYVIGNHDIEMLYSVRFMYDVAVVEKLIIGNTFFMHGHQFDFANAKNKGIGFWITKMVGWLEKHLDKNIDKKTEQLAMWLKKQGRFGSTASYQREAIAYAKGMIVNGQLIKRIIIGHTHVEDYANVDGIEYHNCGTWTNGKSYIVEIEL